jgi:uncharacterized RDD family membrane protein YckC
MYIGFCLRLIAYIADAIILYVALFLSFFFMALLFNFVPTEGSSKFFSTVAVAVYHIGFWAKKQATIGKMLIGAKIIDAKTRGAPTMGQCVGRFFAQIISSIPLFLGFIWIAFDAKKRGWHDMLAGTLVVSSKDSHSV